MRSGSSRARREHEHRDVARGLVGAQRLEHVEARHARQHEVEHDQRIAFLSRRLEGVLAGRRRGQRDSRPCPDGRPRARRSPARHRRRGCVRRTAGLGSCGSDLGGRRRDERRRWATPSRALEARGEAPLDLCDDHLDRHRVVAAARDDHVRVALAGFDELQVHRLHRVQVLLQHRLQRAVRATPCRAGCGGSAGYRDRHPRTPSRRSSCAHRSDRRTAGCRRSRPRRPVRIGRVRVLREWVANS